MENFDESQIPKTSQPNDLAEQKTAWANEVVRLNESGTLTGDQRTQLLAFIEKENYQLSSRELYAAQILLSKQKSVAKPGRELTPFQIDHEEELREKTEEFAQQFFTLNAEARRRTFDSLLVQSQLNSRINKRLKQLEPGLQIDLAEQTPEDPFQKRLADCVAELFVAPIQKRGGIRQGFLQSIWQSNNRFKFVKAAQDLKNSAPELAKLEMDFIEQIANNDARQKTAERNQKALEERYAQLPEESPLAEERSNLVYVFLAISVLGGLIAGLSNNRNRPINSYGAGNQFQTATNFDQLIKDTDRVIIQSEAGINRLNRDLAMQALINRAKDNGDIETVQRITLSRACTMVDNAEDMISHNDGNVQDDGSFVDGPKYSPSVQQNYSSAFELIEEVLPSFPEEVFCLNCKEYFTRACFGHAVTLRQTSKDRQELERVIRLGIEAGTRVVKLDKPEYQYLHGDVGSLWHLLSELQAERGEQEFEITSLIHAISHQRIAVRTNPSKFINEARLDGHLRAFSLALLNANRPADAIAVALERRHLFPNDPTRLVGVARTLGAANNLLESQQGKSELKNDLQRLTEEVAIESIHCGLTNLSPILGQNGIRQLKDDPETVFLLREVLADSLKNQTRPSARRFLDGTAPTGVAP